jgi:hypothetical protein
VHRKRAALVAVVNAEIGEAANRGMKSNGYDCSKCPGYCCSYPLIEVSRSDIARLAKHHGLAYEAAEERFTLYDKDEKVRGLRKRKDEYFGSVCRSFSSSNVHCRTTRRSSR